MSLLIKALQKAEQSKEAAAAEPGDYAHRDLELELAPHHGPSVPDYREEAGLGEPPVAGLAIAAEPKTGRSAQQAAASAVFSAKQSGYTDASAKRALWMGVGGLVFLLMVGVGFYFYLESLDQPELMIARPAPAMPPPATPVAPAPVPVTPSEGPAAVVAETASAPQPSAGQAGNTGPDPAESTKVEEKPAPDEAQPQPAPTVKAEPVVTSVAAATPTALPSGAAAENAAVKVTRSRATGVTVNSHVMTAYQAYMSGDDVTASRLYRQALKSDPRNTDALLGLAAIAARQDKTDEAAAQFMRVLELEPKNVAAQAGLIALLGSADPVASESRLKFMLAQQPEAAFLHAALGNLYADQNQWSNAQQAYFQAYRYDADNAEYAFNLAVSLDQMGKPDLALQYYQRALDLLQRQGGTEIDRSQVEARIAQLRR